MPYPLLLRAGLALILLGGTARAQADAPTVLSCRTQAAAGIVWNADKRAWIGAAVRPERHFTLELRRLRDHTIKVDGDDLDVRDYAVTVTPVGGSPQACGPRLVGGGPSVVAPVDGYITCYAVLTDYYFNPATNRFLVVDINGFLNGADSDAAFPSVSVGQCTPRP